ncbi:Rossmann-like and DUF2520 domain-containing protein [Flavobacterium faecale]|uniref:Rossmann-like and DUF2520 domain-containing protein n=1 Tax=Flavobacterium faecale TaxID=1355330 RepID=UPI003AACB544
MVKVIVIGSGNLAQHLIVAFQEAEQLERSIELVQVFARHKENLTSLIHSDKIVSNWSQLQTADIYILAVSDDSISEVSSQLPFNNQLVVHTSGAMPMENLDSKNRKGVFYPLQSFTKAKKVDFSRIPLCLESENKQDYEIMEKVANTISNKVFHIESQQRQALHVAAVFVNNFTNHLYQIASEICQENQIPFEILQPLIQETAHKISVIPPIQAQTGPAIRNDQKTINAHEQFLKKEEHLQLYRILTQSIQNNGKKL